MSEPSWPAEGRLKAGCSQDWLPHKAAHIFIMRCDAAGVMSNLCHFYDGRLLQEVRVEFHAHAVAGGDRDDAVADFEIGRVPGFLFGGGAGDVLRSEEHTSELQSL